MLKIGDIMTREVFTLAASTPAEQAAWELSVRGFTGAPVCVDRGRVVGILSRSDLVDPERRQSGLGQSVHELMTPALFTLQPSDPVLRAVSLMVREGIRRIVVMEKGGRMVGIVTSTDILELIARGEMQESAMSSSYGSSFDRASAERPSAPM
jgi:predicted transcriptional regulator